MMMGRTLCEENVVRLHPLLTVSFGLADGGGGGGGGGRYDDDL